ncbi:MAG: MarR family transcriptional regulator, partial [Beijerinckiaceae bacterium]|nr:MarR family transcriptional regulator [Beijerinckiaceae bacterium]
VSRRRDLQDGRNVVIQRTVAGALFVEKLGDLVAAKALDLPR